MMNRIEAELIFALGSRKFFDLETAQVFCEASGFIPVGWTLAAFASWLESALSRHPNIADGNCHQAAIDARKAMTAAIKDAPSLTDKERTERINAAGNAIYKTPKRLREMVLYAIGNKLTSNSADEEWLDIIKVITKFQPENPLASIIATGFIGKEDLYKQAQDIIVRTLSSDSSPR